MPKQTFNNLHSAKQNRIFSASLNEFTEKSFEESKLSNIIRDAKIPRGSFYQYFENKLDLYKYVFNKLGEIKMSYMGELLLNKEEKPFIELIRELYIIGIKFAVDNPKAVKMMSFLFSNKGEIYDKVMKDGLSKAKDFYSGYIESDKLLGRISKDINTEVLTDIFISLINNISIEEMSHGNKELDYEHMIDKFEKIIYILERGISRGDNNV